MPCEAELKTLILGLTHVAILVVVTCTTYRELDEQVLSSVQVSLDGTVQLTAEECEVQTEVTCNGGLPLQVGVSHSLRRSPVRCDTVNPSSRACAVGLYQLANRDVVVTCSTVAHAELQVVEPLLGALHEWL